MQGYNEPGNLILGEPAYRRFLDYTREGGERFLSDARIATEYPRLAERAMAQGEAGSSAGGEFPKFTAARLLDGRKADVIVKFSGADDSPAVRRWADLLVCERLASSVMADEFHVAVAESTIHRYAGRTFLEVVRFDRHGDFGRSAVCTIGSIDAALLGSSAPWPLIARQLHDAGWLGEDDAARVALIWWFGRLIGNTDMHEGNLAFRPGLGLAPAYDMLPMMYAPARGGELPGVTYAPALPLPLPGEAAVWLIAARAAVHFWRTCAVDERIGADFRRICESNGRMLNDIVPRF